ncbi:hypothetical protein OH76DRAFT_214342 [Lentinus brumalis]|uniref:Uncharacterized protein n=1 Tax=Lentinus brumalis TaxID=2498619 RepID=A0A371CML1_9APHY|nr:hypothetical protein OH76DRAFT_214342 [Polyporus brumalis]
MKAHLRELPMRTWDLGTITGSVSARCCASQGWKKRRRTYSCLSLSGTITYVSRSLLSLELRDGGVTVDVIRMIVSSTDRTQLADNRITAVSTLQVNVPAETSEKTPEDFTHSFFYDDQQYHGVLDQRPGEQTTNSSVHLVADVRFRDVEWHDAR